MKHRLRSAGFLGALLALIGPELAITTATIVVTPSVVEAQVGGVHRRTRRRTRRRTAAVVHTADMNQAAAQQQQQQQQQGSQQSMLPQRSGTAPTPPIASEAADPGILAAERTWETESQAARRLACGPPGPSVALKGRAAMRGG